MNSREQHLKLYKFFLERELANYFHYLSVMEKSLDEQLQSAQDELQVVKNDIQEIEDAGKDKAELNDLLYLSEKSKGFTNLMRQSFLVSLYSFLELWLMRECYNDSKHNNRRKAYNNISERGIAKAKVYFSKVMKRDFSFGESSEWNWIHKLKLLRDCIVHRQGSLTGFSDFEIDEDLESFVSSEDGLELYGPGNNEIFVTREFCSKALFQVKKLMLDLLIFSTKQANPA